MSTTAPAGAGANPLPRHHADSSGLAALLHQGEHVRRAHKHLHEFVTALLREATERGEARDDIPAGELASYCLHALTAASGLSSEAALGRLIDVTLAGVHQGRGSTKA